MSYIYELNTNKNPDVGDLHQAILISSITLALTGITVYSETSDTLNMEFASEPSGSDQTTIDTILTGF